MNDSINDSQVTTTCDQIKSSIFGKITLVHDPATLASNMKGRECSCTSVCTHCGKPCSDNAKNCYNTPNQNARYKQYLEYLDRLQGKSTKRV